MGVGKAPSLCIPFLSDADELTVQNDLRVTVVSSETHKRFICRISDFHWSHITQQHKGHQLLPFAGGKCSPLAVILFMLRNEIWSLHHCCITLQFFILLDSFKRSTFFRCSLYFCISCIDMTLQFNRLQTSVCPGLNQQPQCAVSSVNCPFPSSFPAELLGATLAYFSLDWQWR